MKKILIILPLVSHASAGRLAALGNCGAELHVIDTSTRKIKQGLDKYPYNLIFKIHDYDAVVDDPYFRSHLNYKNVIIDLLRSKNIIKENKNNAGKLKEIINQLKPEYIITYYGAQGAHYARIVCKLSQDIPILVILNLYPHTLERVNKISKTLRRFFVNEFSDYNSIRNKIYKFICATTEMKDFLMRKLEVQSKKVVVIPDYLPKRFQPTEIINNNYYANKRVPKLIFLGAPERWGASIDNIDSQLIEICSKNIEVHAGNMSLEVIQTGFGFIYDYFTDEQVFNGELSNFAQHFDAALITYNSRERRERFRTTLPTRFLSAISAGIPVAVKAGMFDAVEMFINKNQNGFIYRNIEELHSTLTCTEKMKKYRYNSQELLKIAFAENQFKIFKAILDTDNLDSSENFHEA